MRTIATTFLGCLLLAAPATLATEPECESLDAVADQLMGLDYDAFDQDLQGGWRPFPDEGCVVGTAKLIDRYHERHEDELQPYQARILRWHAGQLYGLADDVEKARRRFKASYNPEEPEQPDFPWNDYVSASIAFLDGDMDKLRHHRERIAASPSKGNLEVVDRLIAGFGKSYRVAYFGEEER